MEIPQNKTCTKCGLTKPLDEFPKRIEGKYGRDSRCLVCKQAYRLAYDLANSERIRQRNAKYWAQHREEHAIWQKQYDTIHATEKKARSRKSYIKLKALGLLEYQKDPGKARARSRDYYATHREEIRIYRLQNKESRSKQARIWYANNQEHILAYREKNREKTHAREKAWRETYPEKHIAKAQRRRARQADAAITDLSPAQFEEIKAVFRYRCAYCPVDCKACKNKTHTLHQEHIQPVFHGGNYTVHNIVPACSTCNTRKSTKPPPVPVQPLLLTIAAPRKSKQKKS